MPADGVVPPARTGHITVTFNEKIYMYVELVWDTAKMSHHLRVVLVERMVVSITMIPGFSTWPLVHGEN